MKKFLRYLALTPIAALLVFSVVIFTSQSQEAGAVIDSITKSKGAVQEEATQTDGILVGKDKTDGSSETHEDEWNLRLVNEKNPLPDDFVPILSEVYEGYEFDSRAVGPLRSMMKAGNEAGLQLKICSAYRTLETQAELFEKQVSGQRSKGLSEEAAITIAKRTVAYPGRSEHNLGLAVDIVSESYQLLDDGFANTKEAIWLKEHCAEYGFILRYPEDKTDITEIIYEPWHFRYVGVEAATYIMENGLCLEEYLQK